MERKGSFWWLRRARRAEKNAARQPEAAGRTDPAPQPQMGRQENRAVWREGGDTRLTDRFSRDLTRMAAAGRLDPVVGRDR
jgi:ATP-dependent Clp protease ATP-binding subunit ClpA